MLQGWQRARCKWIGHSCARLVEEDEPTERCHRLDPPLKRRQLRKDLTICGGKDEHDVALTLRRRAIGDTRVPVHRIARLREHCGSLSRMTRAISPISALRRGAGEQTPFARPAFERGRAAVVELES